MIKILREKLRYEVYKPLYYTKDLKDSYSGASICAGALVGKNAIVTGGGSGIGLAIAQRLLVEGCNVVITGRNEKKLSIAVNSSCGLNTIKYILWDQTGFFDIDEKLTQAMSLFPSGKLDILINNAGVYTDVDKMRRFRSVTEDEYDAVLRTNLKSTYLLSKKSAGLMVKQKTDGHIVNIASICGMYRSFMYTPYGISKASIIAMTELLNNEYQHSGIIVNGIAPGSVATVMGNLSINDNISKGCNILNRTVMPEEIAALATFLASDLGNYLSGQVISASACEVL